MSTVGVVTYRRPRWQHPVVTRQCRCGKSVTARFARYCDDCRCLVRRKPAKYVWTLGRDAILREKYDGRKGTSAAIAAIFRWPTWVIKKRACALGLTRPVPSEPWSKDEERFVLEWAGRRSHVWIARKLKRGETSVAVKMKRMKISRAIREGYTIRELELCFGVDHRVIDRWIEQEKLSTRRRETNNLHKPYQISEDAIIRFIHENPMAFRLDRVDQVWFMDLVVGGGLLQERAS